MKSELKDFDSVDIEKPLSEYIPEVEDDFGFWARLIVGEKEIGGEESFDIFICTPKWISGHLMSDEILIGQYHLIVLSYNYNSILSFLKNRINNIESDSWEEIGRKIGKIGKWEFDDYKEYNPHHP